MVKRTRLPHVRPNHSIPCLSEPAMKNPAQPIALSGPRENFRPSVTFAIPNGSYLKGVLYCLAATTLFGLMFPVMTGALRHVDPFTFASLRYVIAAVASLIMLWLKEGRAALRPSGESVLRAWLLGSVGFAGFGFLVFLGQQLAGRDGALTASIMAATQPMLGVLIHSVARRILPPRATVLFVLLSFCGVALVITKGDIGGLLKQPQSYAANALIVLGMVCWLVYTFGAAQFTNWSVLKYTTVTMWLGLATIIAINLSLIAAHIVAVPSVTDLVAIVPHLLYMSLIASFVGVWCWNLGNKILTPLNAVLFMDVVPMTAFTVSAIGGIIPTGVQIVGACVTGAALILNNLYLRLSARRPPA
jgi:drug/metabolite transporter (DMT)-like permease